jgi:hypothetical protein
MKKNIKPTDRKTLTLLTPTTLRATRGGSACGWQEPYLGDRGLVAIVEDWAQGKF